MAEPSPAKSPPLDEKRVLDAAFAVLETHGFEGLTIRRIADVLGVKNPALYWHFKNKQEIVNGMASRLLDRMTEAPLRARRLAELAVAGGGLVPPNPAQRARRRRGAVQREPVALTALHRIPARHRVSRDAGLFRARRAARPGDGVRLRARRHLRTPGRRAHRRRRSPHRCRNCSSRSAPSTAKARAISCSRAGWR